MRRLDEIAHLRPQVARVGVDWFAEQRRSASARPDHAEQHADGGRLPCAIEAKEGVDLATSDA